MQKNETSRRAAGRSSAGICAWLAAALVLLCLPTHARAATLDSVRERGYLICGVGDADPGFSEADAGGTWRGIDVEFCAAVAAAVLGDKTKVKYRPLGVSDRFRVLQTREVDVLARATTWTLSRETELGLRFAGVLFYDGQGFLVRRDAGISSVLELSGASICVIPGGAAEQGLNEYFRSKRMAIARVTAATWGELMKAYVANRCTLLTGDVSLLATERNRMVSAREHILLPDLITKEPLGPIVRQGDEQWFSIVRWTLMALVAAEELDISSANAATSGDGQPADARRLLGIDGDLGATMDLSRDWALQIVRQVGNYGEIYERTLGAKSPLRLERGFNNLWSKGGLMFAAPLR